MSFRRPFQIFPSYPDRVSKNFLICTDMLHVRYAAMTEDEQKMLRSNGFGAAMPWTNPQGKIDQLCAVLSLDGNIIYQFPVVQKLPGTLLAPLGITADGKKAAVMLGGKAEETSEDGPISLVGNPREVLIWREGGPLKTVKINDGNLTWNALMTQFASGGF